MTLSSPLFDIFIHLLADGAEAVCRSLSNEIKRNDVTSTTALGQGLDDKDSS